MNDSLKKHIDQNREAFENKEPSAELWKRIKAEIPKQEEKTLVVETPKKWRIQNWSIAASTLILLSVGGYFFFKNDKINSIDTTKSIEIVKEKTVEKVENNQSKYSTSIEKTNLNDSKQVVSSSIKSKIKPISVEKEEIILIDENLKNDILLALNDQESTSNRIDAISKIGTLAHLDSDLKDHLFNLSINDNNTIVRLNALETLATKLPKSEVSKELTDIFMKQDDPMVQMELIGMIAHINNDQIDLKLTTKLQEMVLDPRTKPFVKDEAYAVLLRK